jgi:hypothetical protein
MESYMTSAILNSKWIIREAIKPQNLKMIGRGLLNPQNWYDISILSLTSMPKKHTAVALAAIASGTAFYVLQPETLLSQCSVVAIASVTAWATTEIANRTASKLWEQRLSTLESNFKLSETEETKKALEALVKEQLKDIL